MPALDFVQHFQHQMMWWDSIEMTMKPKSDSSMYINDTNIINDIEQKSTNDEIQWKLSILDVKAEIPLLSHTYSLLINNTYWTYW